MVSLGLAGKHMAFLAPKMASLGHRLDGKKLILCFLALHEV